MPTKLEKQLVQSKTLSEFLFHNENLCPVKPLLAYENKTKERCCEANKSQLFIALIRPYSLVSSSTIASSI